MNPPIDFQQLAQTDNPDGYPYYISGTDLMRNFVGASVVVNSATPLGSENLLKSAATLGLGGHATRELYVVNPLPPPPQDGGVFVLGCVNGKTQWVATEKC